MTFLAGAEFTRAYAQRFGSHAAQPEAETARRESETARTPARLPEPAPEPRPAAAMSPDLLELEAASTRAQMNQTWRVIRERVPEPPALPAKRLDGSVAEPRPSWLQVAVAGLAVAVLPMRRRGDAEATWRGVPHHERTVAPRAELREEPQRVPAE